MSVIIKFVLFYNQEEMLEMQEVLASETSQLQKERGRQERIATSITDQIHIEAQVTCSFLLLNAQSDLIFVFPFYIVSIPFVNLICTYFTF